MEKIRIQKSGKIININVVEEVKDIHEIIIEPEDYINVEYERNVEEGKLLLKLEHDLCNNAKGNLRGRVGEKIAQIIIETLRQEKGEVLLEQKPRAVFDFESDIEGIKYDIKTSKEKYALVGNRSYFEFYLSTNKASKDAVQKSACKFKKDYKGSGIDYLLCIGLFEDKSKVPITYLIPTDIKEVKDYDNITIPCSGKTKYDLYKIDLSEYIKSFSESE